MTTLKLDILQHERDNIVQCTNCKCNEYYDYMHWLNGKQYCRACIYNIWEQESNWKHTSKNKVYPDKE